jgi:hypothetical protein
MQPNKHTHSVRNPKQVKNKKIKSRNDLLSWSKLIRSFTEPQITYVYILSKNILKQAGGSDNKQKFLFYRFLPIINSTTADEERRGWKK